MTEAQAIPVDDIPPDVAAAYAVMDTGRTLRMKPEPEPQPEPLEEPSARKRPWDLRLYKWMRKTARLIAVQGLIGYVRSKTIKLLLRVLAWCWRRRLWFHSVRLYLRWKRSDPVTVDVFDERSGKCERCKWRLGIESDDPRCEDPKVISGLYCTACNCPIEERAELENKNAREGHRCPKGFHEGSEPDPYARQTCNSPACKKKRSENHGNELPPRNGSRSSAGV